MSGGVLYEAGEKSGEGAGEGLGWREPEEFNNKFNWLISKALLSLSGAFFVSDGMESKGSGCVLICWINPINLVESFKFEKKILYEVPSEFVNKTLPPS